MKSACTKLGTKEQLKKLNDLILKINSNEVTTIKILQTTQDIYGYLPEPVLKYIDQNSIASLNELYSVASFYAEFSFYPKGTFPISVCMGTACYVNGAENIFNKVCQVLNLKAGETSNDGKFSIDQTRCIGCCGMAPVMTIGEDVYGNVKIAQVEQILKKYMENN